VCLGQRVGNAATEKLHRGRRNGPPLS
jgi:hypothetical protein